MAPNILDGERVLAFDLETTGISTSSDRIVQIALIGAAADATLFITRESSILAVQFRLEPATYTASMTVMCEEKEDSHPSSTKSLN